MIKKMVQISSLLLLVLSCGVSFAAECNYCEGYKVFAERLKKYPAPKDTEMPSAQHAKMVSMAKTIIDEILKESPSLKGEAMDYFVKTLAQSSMYDPGNEIVDHFWSKILAYQKQINQTSLELVKKSQITEAERKRLEMNIAIVQGQIAEGQD